MKALVLTHIGLETISGAEITKIIHATNVTTEPGRIIFECEKIQELIDLCYHGRTFSKVLLLISEHTITDMPGAEILDGLTTYLDKTARVLCARSGAHAFTSFYLETHLNKLLAEKYSLTITFKNPQTTVFTVVDNNKLFVCIDLCGIDLGRRDYRIFLGNDAIKGTIAAGLLFFSDYQTKEQLLDPFCRHGIIPIEAALLATHTSVHKYNKEKFAFATLPKITFKLADKEKDFSGTIIAMDSNFKHVSAAQKNAKIAGVVKHITFSRTDMQWLDAKFGKHFIDRMITFPIQPGRMISENAISKIYHELFYQAEFILKKTGTITLCMKRGVEIAKQKAAEFKFIVAKELKVMQGEEELTFILFSKSQ